MKQTFNVIENYNVSLYEEYKFRQLLDNSNGPNNDFKLRLTSVDIATVLDLRKIPHTYQKLYHAFFRPTSHNQEGLDGDSRSTHMVEEEEVAE